MTTTVMDSTRDDQASGTAIIRVGGEFGSLGPETLAALEGDLRKAIEHSTTGLLIDLDGTDYIGCAFLSVLIRCSHRAAQRNVRFAVCALNPEPFSVFEITRLDSLWEVFRTERGAVDAMQQPPGSGRLHRMADSTATDQRNQRISDAAEACLNGDRRQAFAAVACGCRGGVLLLGGEVPNFYLKQVAQELVAQVAGVTQVINKIGVCTSGRAASDLQ